MFECLEILLGTKHVFVGPERVILGTDSPSARGVVAPGIQRLIQHVIGAAPSVSSAIAIAFATGNTARAYVAPGGRVAVGEPADLVLCRAPLRSSFEDALDAIEHGDWLDVDSVFIGGIMVSDHATRST